MRRRSLRSGASAALLCAALLAGAAPSRAEEAPPPPPPKETPWYQAIGVNVFLETTYTHNFGRPDSGKNQFRVFDTEEGSFRFDVAELVLQKKAAAAGEVGFRVDAIAGSSIPHVTAASGLFRDDETGEAQDFDLLQAFASYVAPVGRGLKVDLGKFTTHMGYEVTEGPDGINDNASHSLLFGWAVPITHTGLRLTYPVGGAFTAMAEVVTGWDNVTDDNSSKSFGAQLAYAPGPAVAMTLNAMVGPEKPKDDADQRRTFDYWVTWKATERLGLAFNADYGEEEGDEPDGGRVSWYGVAGYARVTLDARFALCLRAEVFRDPDGERTGTRQTIHEVTLTPEWKVTKGFVLRGDLRHDWSTEPVFEERDHHAKGQTTASLNAIYSF